eukprot:262613_1
MTSTSLSEIRELVNKKNAKMKEIRDFVKKEKVLKLQLKDIITLYGKGITKTVILQQLKDYLHSAEIDDEIELTPSLSSLETNDLGSADNQMKDGLFLKINKEETGFDILLFDDSKCELRGCSIPFWKIRSLLTGIGGTFCMHSFIVYCSKLHDALSNVPYMKLRNFTFNLPNEANNYSEIYGGLFFVHKDKKKHATIIDNHRKFGNSQLRRAVKNKMNMKTKSTGNRFASAMLIRDAQFSTTTMSIHEGTLKHNSTVLSFDDEKLGTYVWHRPFDPFNLYPSSIEEMKGVLPLDVPHEIAKIVMEYLKSEIAIDDVLIEFKNIVTDKWKQTKFYEK